MIAGRRATGAPGTRPAAVAPDRPIDHETPEAAITASAAFTMLGRLPAALRPAAVPLASGTHLDLSPGLIVVTVVFAVLNIALVIVALVSLIQRPKTAVRFHNKWVWGALILFVNWLGPLAYLALGRLDDPLDEAAVPWTTRPASERAQAAVDLLYGPAPSGQAPFGDMSTAPDPAAEPLPDAPASPRDPS